MRVHEPIPQLTSMRHGITFMVILLYYTISYNTTLVSYSHRSGCGCATTGFTDGGTGRWFGGHK